MSALAQEGPISGLREKTLSALSWSAFAEITHNAIVFVINIILARLLFPKDFGLIAMVTVFTRFAILFSDLGFGSAIIQKQNIEERHLSSVFWLNIIAGVLLTGILAGSSPLLAAFYAKPILIPVTLAVSLTFTIGSFNIVHTALMNKSMDFRKLAFIKIGSRLIAGAIAVAMALIGFGVWSLVADALISGFIQVPIMWRLSDWRPRFIWDSKAIKEMFGFSFNLFGFRTFNYWLNNIDNLLIGKYIGSFALGIYSRAFELMLLPQGQMMGVLNRVMFPALSIIQDDKTKIKEVFLRSNRAIALLSFPMMTGLLIVARPFILTIYGEKWEGVVLILQIFCLNGLMRSITTTVGWIYLSQGRTDIMARWGFFSGAVIVASIVIGLHWGIVGIASAIVISAFVILWYPAWTIPGRLINLSFWEMLKNVSPPFWCSLAMAAAVFVFGIILPSAWPQWARLVTQVPLGVVAYVLLIHVFRIRAYHEVRELAVEQYRRLRPEVPVEVETPL